MDDVPRALRDLIRLALEEDVGGGDWTTRWTVPEGALGRAHIVAKQALVVAGTGAAGAVFRTVDPGIDMEVSCPDGHAADAGEVLLRLEGPVAAILTAERTALNFLGRLSGVATLTRRFVAEVEGTEARVIDTRKTTPGWRALEKAAVRAGGGVNHRMGLHDMVLVKDNHIVAAGGIARAVGAVRRANDRDLAVEVEVRDLDELDAALRLGVDRILLDNMPPRMLVLAVARTRSAGGRRPELEASGNITLATIRAVAETGVDLISVGALTHSAPTADVSLRMDP